MDNRIYGNILLVAVIMALISGSVLGQLNIAPCRDGDTRQCGSDVGECERGTTTCQGGVWGECEGSVTPMEEECSDGLDNDCNGLVDECGFNTASIILIGAGCMLFVVALLLNKLGK